MRSSFLFFLFCVFFHSLNAQSPKWTWINGDSAAYNTVNYGTKGIEDANNNPGFLVQATTWADASGNVWLYSSNSTSAMWKYNNATGLWSWVAGSNTRIAYPLFGTQGVANAFNNPGPTSGGNTWRDASGNLWLFGGGGKDVNGNSGYTNTLWKFNTATLEWTWVNGDQFVNQSGVYGTKGIAAAGNKPGSRSDAALAVDASGNVWMCGGYGKDAFGNTNYLADLWKYNPSTNQWTWISGPNSVSSSGNYGTKGVAASGNLVPGRNYASAWIDATGRFWLFGGGGSGLFNDLWVYNPSTQFWTWMNGDNITYMPGVYGTKGTAASANKPGSRFSPASWKDASGDLWMFGGSGFSELGYGNLNDVWKYTISTNQWTWMHGDNSADGAGVYNTKGTADAIGKPSGRFLFGSAGDAGIFSVYGGQGKDNYGNNGVLDDLWKFNSTTNQWTWLAGNKLIEKPGEYGTKGVASSSNHLSKRSESNAKSIGGKFWLFGGTGVDTQGYGGYLNDLWKFDPSVGQWTWVAGDNLVNQPGIYGTKGEANAFNKPGSRKGSVTWKDATGNLWLFGGWGKDKNGLTGDLNDLWKFNFTTLQWTWISGDDVVNQTGNYGTIGVAAAGNKPGGRTAATGWMDASGNFWIFGGNGYGSSLGYLNDLWKYNIATGEWTWMAGTGTPNSTGSYGSKGVPGPTNTPNARTSCTGWTDASGNLWLFGGLNNLNYFFNDLWNFNTSTNEWVWMSGDNTTNPAGVYGIQGIADINNKPSGRQEAMAYQNASGRFILFGGRGYNINNTFTTLSEVWEYNPATNEWTWISGNNTGNEAASHGTLGVYNASNTPGARFWSGVGDMDADGTMWLFSGSNGANDLWGALTGTILPLHFESFTASKKDQNVVLKWTTSEEINTSYFEVQHSTDGILFKSIGIVMAKSLSRSNYSFVHNNPGKGKHFYRLKQVDVDRRSSLSTTRLITIDEASRLTWYLNNKTVVVRLSNGKNEPFELIDINGRMVKQGQFANGQTQISQLPAGVYTIVVKGNETITTRIVFY
jgi:N-acetylneuraminic acid mutarotase